MMRWYLVVFLVAVGLKITYSAVAIQLAADKPAEFANEEGCYSIDLTRVLPFNQSYSPQDGVSCTQYNCQSDGSISIFTCGALAVPDGCTKIKNLTLPYPDCCDTVLCDVVPLPDTIN